MEQYAVILENNDHFIGMVELNGEFEALDVEPGTTEPYNDFWQRLYDNRFSEVLGEVDSYEILKSAYRYNPGRLIRYLPEDEQKRVQREATLHASEMDQDLGVEESKEELDQVIRDELGDIDTVLAQVDRGEFVQDTIARYEHVES